MAQLAISPSSALCTDLAEDVEHTIRLLRDQAGWAKTGGKVVKSKSLSHQPNP